VKIGILSDTHDRAAALIKAIDALKSAGAEFFIHCGDVGSAEMLDHLAGLPAAFVWGNTDIDRAELQRHAQALNITCLGNSGILTFDGKTVGVTHGDNPTLKQQLLAHPVDYYLHGHTHLQADERVGPARLINPGALHRAAVKTVAILDTKTDDLRFLTIDV
jgi:putative phosphoesterase